MNKVRFKNCIRTLATTADIFAGTIKSKSAVYNTKFPTTSYGGRYMVSMLPGIGSGPKMMQYVQEIFETAHVPVDFEIIKHKDNYEVEALLSIRRNGVAIKGHIPTLADNSSNVTLRNHLDLYTYLAVCVAYPELKCRYPDLNILVFRQNTEGEYAMLEHELKPGVVESLKIITRKNTKRFAKWAFDYARGQKRKKVTVVHKANIMKLSDGLFLKTVKEVANDYPDIEVDDLIVDNCCMQIVSDPKKFDVIVTPNLYGNIVTSIICGLLGGPGLISGQNFGDSYAVFECASRHLSFEDKEYVNPVAMLNASVRMLQYLKLDVHASVIFSSIYKTLVEDKIHTPDLGGTNTGQDMVDTIKKHIYNYLTTKKVSLFSNKYVI